METKETKNLEPKWYSAEECLPPYDEEVIVLSDNINGETVPNANRISFGHRPNPEGWIGRDIATGKVTHYEPKTYDGWNIPDVKYWMFCPEIPEKDNN